jgi:hypothetical protein
MFVDALSLNSYSVVRDGISVLFAVGLEETSWRGQHNLEFD